MTTPATSRRTLTPVVITERWLNPRTGKPEKWAAVSVERSEDGRPVWEYNRIEDEATSWWARYVPTGEGVLTSSLPKARASTASGAALALIEARRKEVA